MQWLEIEADHPAFPGHFPGQPVVPGVMLLEHALELARESLAPAAILKGISAAKFMKPVYPGDVLFIGVEAASAGQLRFVCRVGTEPAALGAFKLAPLESA